MALLFFRFVLLAVAVVLLLSVWRRRRPLRGGRRGKSGNGLRSPDPYRVLGVSRGASGDEIKQAYHRELAQYHPDKVAHLGDELRALAEQKTQEIIQAYKSLDRRR